MEVPKTVDEYIHQAPKELQSKLKEIRRVIREAAPEAVEKISYRMPYYAYKGRLVYFNLNKHHIGVYAIHAPILQKYKKEVAPYFAHKGTLQLPLDKRVPVALIKKLVRAQVKFNDEKKDKN